MKIYNSISSLLLKNLNEFIRAHNYSKTRPSPSEIKQLTDKYSKIIEKNEGEVVKTENWGLLNLSYLIKKNKKGSYIHFKIKGNGSVIDELEKNEAIDKKLLRYLTIKVKKFDLETNYFTKKDDVEKKESIKN